MVQAANETSMKMHGVSLPSAPFCPHVSSPDLQPTHCAETDQYVEESGVLRLGTCSNEISSLENTPEPFQYSSVFGW